MKKIKESETWAITKFVFIAAALILVWMCVFVSHVATSETNTCPTSKEESK